MRHVAEAMQWMNPDPGSSITDWGCGTGLVADHLHHHGFDVRCVDIASNAYTGALPIVEACLWDLPDDMPATDYGFCADVMEHIPTKHVIETFQNIESKTRKSCYFQIALFHDGMGRLIGETLHLSVFPAEWWKGIIAGVFHHAEYRMIGTKHLQAMAYRGA